MTDKLIEQLRDEDSYYRVQEKHWCIDAEELERQRQAAANRIEAQAAEIDIAQKVILEQLKARKEQADEIERLRQILVDAVEIINDQMPGEFPEWEIDAKSALGETK